MKGQAKRQLESEIQNLRQKARNYEQNGQHDAAELCYSKIKDKKAMIGRL